MSTWNRVNSPFTTIVWLTYPWGIPGGKPGMRSEKILVREQQDPQRLPSKCDEVQVQPGDMLIYRTAGGGGWKNPLDRPMGKGWNPT